MVRSRRNSPFIFSGSNYPKNTTLMTTRSHGVVVHHASFFDRQISKTSWLSGEHFVFKGSNLLGKGQVSGSNPLGGPVKNCVTRYCVGK